MDENLLENEKKPESNLTKDIFEWIEIIAFSVLIVVFIFTFFFKVVTIKGESMVNTLKEGQKLIISNMFYEPKYGDIVVVSRDLYNDNGKKSDEPIIKRVIATAGQVVDIDFYQGIVYVDGVALDEPYTNTPTNLSYDIQFPVRVPDNCVFCLGDNRNNSLDSRSSAIGEAGMINKRYILGHNLLRIYPLNKFGSVK